jgi:hypothetical protein
MRARLDTFFLIDKNNKKHEKISKSIMAFNIISKNIEYIISCHHFFPIKNFSIENIFYEKFKDSYWCDTLVLKNTDSKTSLPDTKILLSLPEKETELKCNDIKITVKRIYNLSVVPLPVNKIAITIPVIECSNEGNRLDRGMSGSPCYMNDSIVGMLIGRTDNEEAYILPIYIIMKVINKINNNKIYTIDMTKIKQSEIWFIDDNPVINNTVNHRFLGCMSLEAYMMIEGDHDKDVIINGVKQKYIITPESDHISNLVIRNKNSYKKSLRLMKLLAEMQREEKIQDIRSLFNLY